MCIQARRSTFFLDSALPPSLPAALAKLDNIDPLKEEEFEVCLVVLFFECFFKGL